MATLSVRWLSAYTHCILANDGACLLSAASGRLLERGVRCLSVFPSRLGLLESTALTDQELADVVGVTDAILLPCRTVTTSSAAGAYFNIAFERRRAAARGLAGGSPWPLVVNSVTSVIGGWCQMPPPSSGLVGN